MEFDNTCLHCQHYFDVNNLKTERRRKLMKHSDVDLIETIANCYQLEENLLGKYVEENEDTYVCDACFKSLKTIYNSQKKCKQLTDTLKEKVSNNFKNLTIKCKLITARVKRKTNLQGPTKLACRALVMKQYKTALNHLLQINEEWYFEHGDMFKLYSILCELCTSHNIALEVTEIIKEQECEEIQSIVFTASRLQSKIDINSPEMSECIENIKSSAF
ncbi:unnamed protein product [Mytilus edulis]|uniref:Uncharacterized protein n=1 Tax=Mytilus edulis TaxID=6550 RepID=A0A8S3RJS4_MYTED|nr:unnamed protein product [Mytilus edulis]